LLEAEGCLLREDEKNDRAFYLSDVKQKYKNEE